MEARAPRQMTVLINAAVVQGSRDGLCRIRNMSETGLQIETALPIELERPLDIVLQSGRSLACVPHWTEGGRTGLSCTTNPTEILTGARVAGEADTAEPILPRFERQMEIEIAAHGFVHVCELHSISTKDVILTSVPDALHGTLITVCVPRLGEFTATIRARDGGDLFARFETPVAFADLNRWLAQSA